MKIIVTPTTGLNHIDLDEAHRQGTTVLSLEVETEFLNDVRATAEHGIQPLVWTTNNLLNTSREPYGTWRNLFLSPNSMALMLACQMAKLSGCDWLITGEGCDGLFNGGIKSLDILAAKDGDSIEAKFKQIVLSYSVTAPALVSSILSDTYEVDLSGRFRILEHAAREYGTNNHENMLQAFSLRTYSERDSRRMYRMSAASSVTCVSPFLTEVFADFLFAFPFQTRNHNGIAKYPMVRLAAKIFGEPFANRPKDGFNIPNGRWFRSELGLGRYRPFLLEERTLSRPFYKPEALRKALLLRLENDNAPLDYLLWSTLNLELWMRMFIDGDDFEYIEDAYPQGEAVLY